jgi:excisionase family DNA binding protein
MTAPLLDALRPLVAELVAAELAKRAAPASPLISTREAADLAGVEMATIRRWMKKGKLTRRNAGRHLRFMRAEIEACLRTPHVRNGNLSPEQLAERDFG